MSKPVRLLSPSFPPTSYITEVITAGTSVMYDVGGKDGDRSRTGFAHFFEHLLFEGSENIERGEV